MLPCLLLCVAARAESYVHSFSEEHLMVDLTAQWAMPMYHGGRWRLAVTRGGDIQVADLDLGTLSATNFQRITGRSDLNDPSLRACPGGGFLLITQSTADENPFWRLDDSFAPTQQGIIPQGEPAHAPNDGLGICTPSLVAAGFAQLAGEADYLYPITDDGGTKARVALPDSPRLSGAGAIADPQDPTRIHVAGFDAGHELVIATYDEQLQLAGRVLIEPPPKAGHDWYWPTGFLAVEGGYLVALMGRDGREQWELDQGNLFLLVLDHAFSLVEWHAVTNYAPMTDAAMRPWLARHEDTLVLGIDRANHPVLFTATVDLDKMAELGPPAADTGAPDTAPPGDEDTGGPGGDEVTQTKDPPASGGCGSRAAALLAVGALLGLRSRSWPGS